MDEQYINISYNMLKKKGISSRGKLIYGFVSGFFEGDCCVSNEYLAKVLGTTTRTVQREVKKLIDKELIIRSIVIKDKVIQGRILKIRKKRNENK